MSDNDTTPKQEYEPPEGTSTTAAWTAPDGTKLDYTVNAGWETLRKNEKPAAEIFSVSYVATDGEDRPITFVFNGGPGASSAYLHVGTAGPRIVEFPADGTLPEMPARLVDNPDSWLGFTDLVFVDPVGTGFSRVIESEKTGDDKPKDAPDPKEYYGVNRDLESLGEFMGRWLSNNRKWGAPVFIAGESYGGFRVAKLARRLQETDGIGLNGAILISPALEIAALESTDYDVLPWIDKLPTMAAAAVHHGRSGAFEPGTPLDEVWAAAEEFATGDYATFLTRGAAMDVADREAVLDRLASLTGLNRAIVERNDGRIDRPTFTRELLRDERRVLGWYDATVSAIDPYPDREPFAGPDPTLAGIGAAYTGAINALLRSEIGLETTREYALLSYQVNTDWKLDMPRHALEGAIGATDDFRYGMALNPHMRAFLCHGRHDLVTPYYASDRIRNLMRLDESMEDRLTVHHFEGGHMFYSKAASRAEFQQVIAGFVASCLAGATP